MTLNPTQRNRQKFLRPRNISSRQVILTLQNTILITETFGTMWPINSVIYQLTRTNWSGTPTLRKSTSLARTDCKVKIILALLHMTLSFLFSKMRLTSPPYSMNPMTQLPPLLTAILLSQRYLKLMLSWRRLSYNLETAILPENWSLTPSMWLMNDSNSMDL